PLRIVDIGRVVDLVPDVIAEQPRMALVAGGERGEEGAGGLLHLGAVHGQRAGAAAIVGEAAHGRADAHDRLELAAVGADLAGMSELAPGPVGNGVGEFGDDGLDAVFGGKVHLPIVVVPVVDARAALDGGPHEPVPEHVEPVFGGNA